MILSIDFRNIPNVSDWLIWDLNMSYPGDWRWGNISDNNSLEAIIDSNFSDEDLIAFRLKFGI